MAKTQLPKPDIRFIARTEKPTYSTSPGLNLRLRPVHINQEQNAHAFGAVLNPQASDRFGTGAAVCHLDSFECLAYNDLDDKGWWGGNYSYSQPHAVGLNFAKDMVKTLTLLERKLVILDTSLGYPTDTIESFRRVAAILGANKEAPFLVPGDTRRVGEMIEGGRYVGLDINSFRAWLDKIVENARD